MSEPSAADGPKAAPQALHDYAARVPKGHNPSDPDPYLALFLDRSVPMDLQARAALVLDLRSFSRRLVHRVVKPLSRAFIAWNGLLKLFWPNAWTSSRWLHKLIHWGLRWFVAPTANFLILRHFHMGSEILAFIAANAPVRLETSPLRPTRLVDVEDDLFVKHDLNLYNFIIRLNEALTSQGKRLVPPARLDFSMITDGPLPLEPFPTRWTNFLDVSSAIEIYTPMFQAFLTDSDFRRAYHSLQLDETIAIYVASLLGDPTHLALVNNRHPLVPLSAFRAGHRLVLHGLGSESLHELLVLHKRLQKARDEKGLPTPPGGQGLGALLGASAIDGGLGPSLGRDQGP